MKPRSLSWHARCRIAGSLGALLLLCSAAAHAGEPIACVGDCNRNGSVTVDDILKMVNVALGSADLTVCMDGDADGNSHIMINEIILAVNNALGECPALGPTPTATASPTPGPPGSVPERAAGTTITTVQALRAVSAVVSSLTQLASGFGAAAFDGQAAAAKPCGNAGSRDVVCTQPTPLFGPRDYTLTFDDCVLNASAGGTVTVAGTVTAQATETGTCEAAPFSLPLVDVSGVQVAVKDAQGMTTLSASFSLTGSVSPAFTLRACPIAKLDMTLSGTTSVQTGDLRFTAGFDSTHVVLEISQYSADCVPVKYKMTVDGPAAFSNPAIGDTLSGTFTRLVFTDDSTSGNDLVTVNGKIASTCLGTEVTYTTTTALAFPPTMPCPSAGVVTESAAGTSDRVIYLGVDGVSIDLANNGSIDKMLTSCLDPQLYACTAEP